MVSCLKALNQILVYAFWAFVLAYSFSKYARKTLGQYPGVNVQKANAFLNL